MNINLYRAFLFIILLIPVITQLSFGQIPNTLSYQGVLTDTNGTVVPDGNYNLTFKLYDVTTGGTALWAEGHLVSVSKGIFNVILGSISPLSLSFDKPYHLGVTVGAGGELTPRISLTSSSYSLRSIRTDSINGINAGGELTGTYPNPSITNNAVTSAKILDGTIQRVDVVSNFKAPYADTADAARTSAPSGNAGGDLTGTYPNPTIAYGAVTSTKIQVPLSLSGYSGSSSAIISGVNLSSGCGVYGYNEYYGNYGYLGTAWMGVYGYSPNNIAVYGYSSNYGVYGRSVSGIGVYGYSGTYYGVYGSDSSSGNYGCLGGINNGVYGSSSNGTAVFGYSSSGYAGYFSGNVNVTGNFNVGGIKSFKIDHPLDPANKYLVHFCVESDEVLNIYNGSVITDANGETSVTLPDYFETLNREFRYQLTVIGQFAQAIVSEKIKNNRFTIKTDKPNVEVSWQVTGIRNDPYVKAHPAQVEVEKTSNERGKYIHPKENGVSETLGIDYEEIHKMEEVQSKMKAEREKMEVEQHKMMPEMEGTNENGKHN